ncbi:MAG: DnaA regulatory inactivator Hda [Thiogranum sp.]|nr:DnaA regulatory inactivator Hda [Thiogranum sp.]
MSRQLALGLRLKASARFDNFIAESSAELVDQLQRCASGQGETFFACWGAPGSGKSHLLQAACQHAADAGRSVSYVSLRDHAALEPELLEGWENFDLVCIDDIDAIAGDARWETALFHLYNRIRERGAQLIISAARPPARLDIDLADLRSRLSWGVVYQLQPLRDQQLLQALQMRARERGCEIPDDTAAYLLKRLPRDTASLFDMLEHLDQASLVAQRKLTVPFVKAVLNL